MKICRFFLAPRFVCPGSCAPVRVSYVCKIGKIMTLFYNS